MRKQTFDRINKTLAILLAVFFVITFTAASASACAAKVANNFPNKVVNPDDSGLTEAQKTALGNQLLDMFDNGNGNGWDGYNNGLNGYNNGWNGYNNGLNGYNNGWNGYNNGWNGYNNGFDNNWEN